MPGDSRVGRNTPFASVRRRPGLQHCKLNNTRTSLGARCGMSNCRGPCEPYHPCTVSGPVTPGLIRLYPAPRGPGPASLDSAGPASPSPDPIRSHVALCLLTLAVDTRPMRAGQPGLPLAGAVGGAGVHMTSSVAGPVTETWEAPLSPPLREMCE